MKYEIEKVKLKILNDSYQLVNTNSYIILLSTEDETKKFPMIIHESDALYFNMIKENIEGYDKLMHGNMLQILKNLDVKLNYVIIDSFSEGIFNSLLECTLIKEVEIIEGDFKSTIFEEKNKSIPCRTTDALMLALIANVPIYIWLSIINEIGTNMDDIDNVHTYSTPLTEKKIISNMDLIELESLLNECIKNEDYLQAAKIRDEIKSRKNK